MGNKCFEGITQVTLIEWLNFRRNKEEGLFFRFFYAFSLTCLVFVTKLKENSLIDYPPSQCPRRITIFQKIPSVPIRGCV